MILDQRTNSYAIFPIQTLRFAFNNKELSTKQLKILSIIPPNY